MPNRSRDKGSRAEREIVELLRSHGLDAYRIPLSGAVTGFKSDIEIRLGNQVLKLESKVRAKGFRNIYRWLTNNDGLVIKADREKTLIVLDLDLLAKVLSLIPHNQAENVTHKTSEDPFSKAPAQEPSPRLGFVDPNELPNAHPKVFINPARVEPIAAAPLRYQDTAKEGS